MSSMRYIYCFFKIAEIIFLSACSKEKSFWKITCIFFET